MAKNAVQENTPKIYVTLEKLGTFPRKIHNFSYVKQRFLALKFGFRKVSALKIDY